MGLILVIIFRTIARGINYCVTEVG